MSDLCRQMGATVRGASREGKVGPDLEAERLQQL